MDKTYCLKCMQPNEGYSVCPHCGYVAGAELSTPHVLRPGTILRDQYLLGEPLGQGGFGITYIARDLNLDIRVAIKEYFPRGYAARNAETADRVTVTDERDARRRAERKDALSLEKNRPCSDIAVDEPDTRSITSSNG